MTSAAYSSDYPRSRSASAQKSRKPARSIKQTITIVTVAAVVLLFVWICLRSWFVAQLNRLSVQQTTLQERNARLLSENQQMKSQYIFASSPEVIGRWAEAHNMVREIAPEKSDVNGHNQASAITQ